MARTDIEVRVHSTGADEVARDLNKVEKAQKSIGNSQDKMNKSSQQGEVRLNALADALDNMGLTGAASLFSVGEGVNELTGGFKGLGGAIAASGIGIIIALAPQIIEGVSKIVERVSGWGSAQEKVNEELAKSTANAVDGLVDLKRYSAVLEDVNASEEARVKAMEKLTEMGVDLQGVTLENVNANEAYKKSIDEVTKSILNQARTEAAREMLIELEKERLELVQEIANDELTFQELLLGKTLDTVVQASELNSLMEKRNVLLDVLTEGTEEQLEAEVRLEEVKARAAKQEIEAAHEIIKLKKAQALLTGEVQHAAVEQEIAGQKRALEEITETRETLASRLENFANNAADSGQIYADGVKAVTEAVGLESKKAFQINKAAQIAETIVSTYSAAQKAYNSQLTVPSPDAPVRAAVAAGIAIAQGLARVAAIKNTQFEGGGGSSGGGAPRTTFSNSNFNPPQAGNPNGTQEITPAPVQAYVIGQDITNQQALDSELRVRSKL